MAKNNGGDCLKTAATMPAPPPEREIFLNPRIFSERRGIVILTANI
ncbi:MAG: hypothetical protein ACI4QA_07030 [Candidatus Spyradosoma sp.]